MYGARFTTNAHRLLGFELEACGLRLDPAYAWDGVAYRGTSSQWAAALDCMMARYQRSHGRDKLVTLAAARQHPFIRALVRAFDGFSRSR
tara:strand:+ start:147 stop:416 length:270 start_codon:yes stop_codon:yes gene_type:complete